GLRAGVAVVARAAVELGGIRARAGRRVAGPRVVTLVGRGANDAGPACGHAGLADVGLRAGVAVGPRAAVELGGIRAGAGRRVAGPRVVSLVGRGADDGVPALAHRGSSDVGLRAGVAVGARAPVGLGGVRACTGRRVARPRAVALVL